MGSFDINEIRSCADRLLAALETFNSTNSEADLCQEVRACATFLHDGCREKTCTETQQNCAA